MLTTYTHGVPISISHPTAMSAERTRRALQSRRRRGLPRSSTCCVQPPTRGQPAHISVDARANAARTVFRDMSSRRAISFMGTPSARCSRRISAQSSTLNTPRRSGQGGRFSGSPTGSLFRRRQHTRLTGRRQAGDNTHRASGHGHDGCGAGRTAGGSTGSDELVAAQPR